MEKEFWDKRWENKETGWDVGTISTPLKTYIDQITDKNIRILIPGCGNSYEAEYLNEIGFKNVYIIDISDYAVASFKKRCPDFPLEQILCDDFFELKDTFDLIIEQTFFCAINPEMRKAYVEQMFQLLQPNGKLVGLMFDFPLDAGPPFGGSIEEYKELFAEKFIIAKMEKCNNSIEPRAGRELWVSFIKK
jgi:thiopurine S-methyltransferase